MDTTELLKAALDAVKAAQVPKELQATALELAVADLRAGSSSSPRVPGKARPTGPSTSGGPLKKAVRKTSPRPRADPKSETKILSQLPEEPVFFKSVEKETGVSVTVLSDIFHVDNGNLQMKIPSRSLGTNKRAQAQTVTALLAGAVFAGTKERKLSFGEINRVCGEMHCLDSGNAATSIKATPGFGSIGAGPTLAVVIKSGWQDEFARATRRVLGRPEPNQ